MFRALFVASLCMQVICAVSVVIALMEGSATSFIFGGVMIFLLLYYIVVSMWFYSEVKKDGYVKRRKTIEIM